MREGASSTTAAAARAYVEAFADADPDTIAALVSDDFVNEHTAALGTGCVGRAAYRERLPDFLASMPGLRYRVDDLVVDGHRAAVFYTMTGRWEGTPFEVRGAQRLEVRDGLIASRLDHWDSAVFLRQVDADAASLLATVGLA